MPNDSLLLFRAWSKKFTRDKQPVEPEAATKTVLTVIDHFNDLHLDERNRHSEMIRALVKRIDALERRLPPRSNLSYEEEPR